MSNYTEKYKYIGSVYRVSFLYKDRALKK